MRALIDGDIYAFRPAAASENEDLNIAVWRMEEMIDNTLAEVGADSLSIFLSGENNFRYEVYPEYKANRPKERPRHLKDLKNYLINIYGAVVSDGCEADDLLGIAQCQGTDTIICSLDKDLRMIPGKHYSFEISGKISRGPRTGETWIRKAEHLMVEPFEGLRRFYAQILTGDSTDNVKGAAGIGAVKAERLLADCRTEQDLFDTVKSQFSSEEELLMTGRCIWIWRESDGDWIHRYKKLQRLQDGETAT